MQDNALFIFPFNRILQIKLSLTSPQNIVISDSAKLFHNSVVDNIFSDKDYITLYCSQSAS